MIGLRGLARLLMIPALLLVATACSGPTGTTSSLPASAAPALQQSEYTLGSGDSIEVTVFGDADNSGEFDLDGQGRFSMSLIGEIDAFGLTTRELEARIASKLSEGYLVDPRVSVELMTSRPFYIRGEVNSAGEYEYKPGMNVLNAVAMAGDFTYRAKQNGVTIRRGGANATPVLVSGDTPVLPGDIIEVPERWF